jgi:hypothetical protein
MCACLAFVRSAAPAPSSEAVVEPSAVERSMAIARLDEAEWWEHLVPADHGTEHASDCMYCERLLKLRQAVAMQPPAPQQLQTERTLAEMPPAVVSNTNVLATLTTALRRIALGDGDCDCTHDDENCCEVVGEFCSQCMAAVALRAVAMNGEAPQKLQAMPPAGQGAHGWNVEQILVYIWQCLAGEGTPAEEYPYERFRDSEIGKRVRVELGALAARREPSEGRKDGL